MFRANHQLPESYNRHKKLTPEVSQLCGCTYCVRYYYVPAKRKKSIEIHWQHYMNHLTFHKQMNQEFFDEK